MNINLDFLVIGAQKCATTWLYECLNDHQSICLPKHKREIEYIGGPLYKQNGGKEWYLSLLNHCSENKVRGDVSVEYIIDLVSPELIYQLNPSMKFILSIRNPTERALSAIKWYIRKGNLPENTNTLKNDIAKATETFIPTEDILTADILQDILHRGFYKKSLNNYLRFFPKSSFLIVDYEDIQRNPEKIVKSIYTFLGVDNTARPQSLLKKPKKNSNNKLLMKIERRFAKNKYVSFIIDKLHQLMPEKKKNELTNDDKEIKEILDRFYSKHSDWVNI